MAVRSAARHIQEQAILAQLGEAAWRVRNGAVADLPNGTIADVREALSALNASLAVAHLAASKPEPEWPVAEQPRDGWEHEAETSLLRDRSV